MFNQLKFTNMKKTFLFAALAAFTLLATSCGDADAEANSIIGTSIKQVPLMGMRMRKQVEVR
jgi:ABC-type sugar transport system substrate-binding protein